MKTISRKDPLQTERAIEPSKKDHMIFIRLPNALSVRFKHQSDRLTCSMNMLARQAIVRHLEELEFEEKKFIQS